MLKVAFLAGLGREEEAGIEIEGRLFRWQSWSQAAKAAEVLEVLVCLATRSVCFHKRIKGSKGARGAPSRANTFFW